MTTEANRPPCQDLPQPPHLTREQIFGLTPWFINLHKDKRLDRFCRAGYVFVWMSRVEELFAENGWGPPPHRPTAWASLGKATGRNSEGMTRYGNSQNDLKRDTAPRVPPTLLRYAVAWALGREDCELSPTTEEWIASTTRILMLKFDTDAYKHVSNHDRDVYGAYLSRAQPSDDCSLDMRLVGELFDDRGGVFEDPGHVLRAILKTASVVGAILIRELGWN